MFARLMQKNYKEDEKLSDTDKKVTLKGDILVVEDNPVNQKTYSYLSPKSRL